MAIDNTPPFLQMLPLSTTNHYLSSTTTSIATSTTITTFIPSPPPSSSPAGTMQNKTFKVAERNLLNRKSMEAPKCKPSRLNVVVPVCLPVYHPNLAFRCHLWKDSVLITQRLNPLELCFHLHCCCLAPGES